MYPAMVTRVEGLRHVYVEYDCKNGEEYIEAAENLQPRTQMP